MTTKSLLHKKKKCLSKLARVMIGCVLALVLTMQLASCASTVKYEKPVQTQDDLAAYFESHGIPRCASTMPELYFSSQDWMARLLQLIDSAHDYILVTVFIGSWSEFSAPVYEALARKAEQGVRVYFMIDPSSYEQYYSDGKTVVPAPTKKLAASGVHVAEYNPLVGERLLKTAGLLDREHRKFWIIDGKYVATGGTNLGHLSCAPLSLGGHLDTFVGTQSEEAARLMVKSFCVTWNAFSPEHIDPVNFSVQPLTKPETTLWLADQALGDNGATDAMFDAFFLYAKKEIWMIQSFPFVTQALLDKIRAATSRGIVVNVLVSNSSDNDIHKSAAQYCMKPLIDAGANLYLYDPPQHTFLHYKLMMTDRHLVAFGSANFNLRSQYLSREMEFIFDNEEIGHQTYDNLEQLLKSSYRVSLESVQNYRDFSHFVSYLVMLVGG